MKKVFLLLLATTLIFSICACNATNSENQSQSNKTSEAIVHEGIIPEGGQYIQGRVNIEYDENGICIREIEDDTSVTYEAGDEFPTPVPTLIEYYFYGDYVYTNAYNGLNPELGLEVYVLDRNKTTYGQMLSEVNGYPVSNLNWSFHKCKNLIETPHLSENATSMNGTFQDCSSLKEITKIPEKVTTMTYAFKNCTSLEKFPQIPESVQFISDAFYNCTSLQGECVVPANMLKMKNAFFATKISSLVLHSSELVEWENCLLQVENDIKVSGSCTEEMKQKVVEQSGAKDKVTIE